MSSLTNLQTLSKVRVVWTESRSQVFSQDVRLHLPTFNSKLLVFSPGCVHQTGQCRPGGQKGSHGRYDIGIKKGKASMHELIILRCCVANLGQEVVVKVHKLWVSKLSS